MKQYVVDRIENKIAILEDINTKEKKEVNIDELPEDIKDGCVLSYENDEYYHNSSLESERKMQIQDRFSRLKKKSS